jgi:hypothetical protein
MSMEREETWHLVEAKPTLKKRKLIETVFIYLLTPLARFHTIRLWEAHTHTHTHSHTPHTHTPTHHTHTHTHRNRPVTSQFWLNRLQSCEGGGGRWRPGQIPPEIYRITGIRNVELSVYKDVWWSGGIAPFILCFGVNGDECSTPYLNYLTPGVFHKGDFVALRVSLDALEKYIMSFSAEYRF